MSYPYDNNTAIAARNADLLLINLVFVGFYVANVIIS